MREIKRLLSWVRFLEPLSEEELEALVRRAAFSRLDDGGAFALGPEEYGEHAPVAR